MTVLERSKEGDWHGGEAAALQAILQYRRRGCDDEVDRLVVGEEARGGPIR